MTHELEQLGEDTMKVKVMETLCEEIEQQPVAKVMPTILELKQFPDHLRYAYLEEEQKMPVVIATDLIEEQRSQLLEVLKKHKKAIAWQISDIKGISHTICMHKILLEEKDMNNIESQRRLNPIMKEVVKRKLSNGWMMGSYILFLTVYGLVQFSVSQRKEV